MFDDDAHKALPGEELNFVQVPCWDDTDDNDNLIKELVESVKEVWTTSESLNLNSKSIIVKLASQLTFYLLFQKLGSMDVGADVRQHTAAITEHLMRNTPRLGPHPDE